MATVFAKVQGVQFTDGPLGSDKGGMAVVTIELTGAFVAGTDTVQIGGGGFDGDVATSATLAAIMQGRRRDAKTVTLLNGYGYAPGQQLAAGASVPTVFYAQTATVSGGNLTLANLFTAATGGTGVSATALGVRDRAIQIEVGYLAA